jgi:hypothetical protein
MLGFALFLAVGPMLFFIPHFNGWRSVVGWVAGLGMAACSPLMAALIPRKEQERYRQALIESELRRRNLSTELSNAKEFSRGLMIGTGEVRAAAVAAAVQVARDSKEGT